MDGRNGRLVIVDKIEIKKSINGNYGINKILAEEELSAGAMENPSLARLFKAFFNNKMTVLIFLCYSVRHAPAEAHLNSISCFLDDLYRHMLEGDIQRRYRRKFIWLKGFIRKLPDVRLSQRGTALQLIQSLYNIFGIELRNDFKGGAK